MVKLTAEMALDLDRHIGRPLKNRISRVGIELEGAWDVRVMKGKSNFNVQRDGSVHFPNLDGHNYLVGELPSPPREVGKGTNTDFREWMRQYYPQVVNATCGMHVHMSLINALTYARLMTPAYPATVLKYVQAWATKAALPGTDPIWERLAGRSVYCKHQYSAEEQIVTVQKDFDRDRAGNRYTVVHYPYSRIGTVECRLLSMMQTVDVAIEAIENLIHLTNAFLVATAKREEKLTGKLDGDGTGPIIERTMIRV